MLNCCPYRESRLHVSSCRNKHIRRHTRIIRASHHPQSLIRSTITHSFTSHSTYAKQALIRSTLIIQRFRPTSRPPASRPRPSHPSLLASLPPSKLLSAPSTPDVHPSTHTSSPPIPKTATHKDIPPLKPKLWSEEQRYQSIVQECRSVQRTMQVFLLFLPPFTCEAAAPRLSFPIMPPHSCTFSNMPLLIFHPHQSPHSIL